MSSGEWHVVSSKQKKTPQAQSLAQQSRQYHQQRSSGMRQSHRGPGAPHHRASAPVHHHAAHAEKSPTAEEISSPQHHEDTRKTLAELNWDDIQQLRRLIPHLETIANYSKGGIIGALRGKLIHNAEDREQQLRSLRDSKVTEVEEALLKHLVEYCDNAAQQKVTGFSREDTDTLLGFLSIILSCVAHMRYAAASSNGTPEAENSATETDDNYLIYHQKMEAQVWNSSQIASNLKENLHKELQQKFDTHPPVMDSEKLQKLLLGDGFKFDYEGNLSVPFILERLHEHVNCNEAKTVRQRRNLYRYEQRPTAQPRSAPAAERSSWRAPSVQRARDYKSQVETFELQYLDAEGVPVDGINTLSSLLHTVYTSFLKIRKKQTPKDLLERLKTLLITLPNLIQLPELLQEVKGDKTWLGNDSIEESSDLSDYKDLQKRLRSYLDREGVKKASSDSTEALRQSLQSLYDFNRVEQEKLDTYLQYIRQQLEEPQQHSEDQQAEQPPAKGYPLESRYIQAFLKQLNVENDSKFQKEVQQLKKFMA